MRIVERDRRSEDAKRLDQLDRLSRQNRKLLDGRQRDWDQGFACAIDMFARGATLEEMRTKVRRPQEVPHLARGTRDFDRSEDETKPLRILREEV